MDFGDTPQEAAFRREVREFLRQELPPELCRELMSVGSITDMRYSFDRGPVMRRWLEALRRRGWLASHWPREHGGAGLSPLEQLILKEELARARAPIPWSIGLNAIGPTIIVHGTQRQKERYLPSILDGDVWCQGFSEPMVGSDLAAVATRALRDGDGYVIQGDKIWTTGGHKGRFMLLLARTDPQARKHHGLSCFIADMQAPGVTIKPLMNLADTLEIAQVFFDDARVPREDLLGEENQGWQVANTTLNFERSTIGEAAGQPEAVQDLAGLARQHWGAVSPALRQELAQRFIEAAVARLLAQRVGWLLREGLPIHREAAMAKLFGTELAQRLAHTGLKVLGPYGQLGPDSPRAPLEGMLGYFYLESVKDTIAGGTSEIARNVIAIRGLGLPRAPEG